MRKYKSWERIMGDFYDEMYNRKGFKHDKENRDFYDYLDLIRNG